MRRDAVGDVPYKEWHIFVSYEDFAMWQICRVKQNKASDGSRTRTEFPFVAKITICIVGHIFVFYEDFAMCVFLSEAEQGVSLPKHLRQQIYHKCEAFISHFRKEIYHSQLAVNITVRICLQILTCDVPYRL